MSAAAWAAEALFGAEPSGEAAETIVCFHCHAPLARCPGLPSAWLADREGKDRMLCPTGDGRLHAALRINRA